jgi:hypothetical protein
MTARNHWIGVVSRAHARLGVEGSFIQLNHGQKAPLQRFHAGDGLLIYSPKTAYPDGETLQAFTAIGIVRSGEFYQVEMSPNFKPYRMDVGFLPCEEVSIRPLIDGLTFIKSKTHWGAAFRFGLLKVPAADFIFVAEAMRCGVFAEDEQ